MAVMTAQPRLSRRSLERQGMTPAQELDLLIQEQAADDTPYVDKPAREVSLDASVSLADGDHETIGMALVGRDPWELIDDCIDLGLDPAEVAHSGEVICLFRPRRGDGLADPRRIDHGTFNGYNNQECRCSRCRAFMSEYRRSRRAAT